ncbi:MAG: hypothetical protein KBA55_15740, partial [Ruminococcus sp.]|nr:hypothetical protein [Ruminococcus sp.]
MDEDYDSYGGKICLKKLPTVQGIDPYPEKWTLIRSVKSKHIYKSESARIKKQTNYQVRENSAN